MMEERTNFPKLPSTNYPMSTYRPNKYECNDVKKRKKEKEGSCRPLSQPSLPGCICPTQGSLCFLTRALCNRTLEGRGGGGGGVVSGKPPRTVNEGTVHQPVGSVEAE